MEQYRLSKYNPEYKGIYNNEWTSYSDIGKSYNGEKFTKRCYLEMEKKYCDAIITILSAQQTRYIKIRELETPFSSEEIAEFFFSKNLRLTDKEKEIIESIDENQIILIDDIEEYLKLLLRECFWCVLLDPEHKIHVDIGYDYYVHLACNYIDPDIICCLKNQGIYIEKLTE